MDEISPTRLLTVQTKFLINNKTPNNLKCEVISHNICTSQTREFIGLSECEFISSRGFYPTGEIINSVVKTAGNEPSIGNEDSLVDAELNQQYALLEEKTNDLFYFRIKEISREGKPLFYRTEKQLVNTN